MSKDEYIEYLIKQSKSNYKKISDNDFIKLYEEIKEVLNSSDYTTEQKNKLRQEGFLESMAITADWIKNYK